MGGLGHNKWIYEPIQIPYFVVHRIRIKELQCGSSHALAIDMKHSVYAWGDNQFCQTGHGSYEKCVNEPKKIEFFDGKIVIGIECGSYHSYCKTDKEKHYMFGSNYENECCHYKGWQKVPSPFCINGVVAGATSNGKRIKAVSLGHFNTKIIVH